MKIVLTSNCAATSIPIKPNFALKTLRADPCAQSVCSFEQVWHLALVSLNQDEIDQLHCTTVHQVIKDLDLRPFDIEF